MFEPASDILLNLGVLGLALLLAFIGLLFLAATKQTGRQMRWGIVMALSALVVSAIVVGGFTRIASRSTVHPLPPDSIAEAREEAAPAAQIVTLSDQLDAAGVAVPKIKLDDGPSTETDSEAEIESFLDLDEIPTQDDRPAWLDAEPKPNQRVFTAGPYATRAPHDVTPDYTDWVWDQASVRQPDLGPTPPAWWGEALHEIKQRTQAETYIERRETSVGTVYLHHTLAQVDDDDQQWLSEQAKAWQAKNRRERGVRHVTLAGGALLAGVAVLHGFLRGGNRSDKPAA